MAVMFETAEGTMHVRRRGLDFEPGTPDWFKHLLARLCDANEVFNAYRMGRVNHNTSDLVLLVSDQDPEIKILPRAAFLKDLRARLGHLAPKLQIKMAHHSAHEVVKVPAEWDAMWIVVCLPQQEPIPCAVFSTPELVGTN